MKRLMIVWVMILCLAAMGGCAEEAFEDGDVPFDAVAAFTGRWLLDSVEYDDGSAMTRQELTETGYDEAVTFTADGGFSVVAWMYGSVCRTESHAWKLTGANFVTLDGTKVLPFGFRDGQLLLIRNDGRYFYHADTGEMSDPKPAPIDEALLGSWTIESLTIQDGSRVLDHDMLDSIGYFATAEFTVDHRWIDTFYGEDGSVQDTQLSWYAIIEPGVIRASRDTYPYIVDGDRLTVTDTYNGLVLVFRRIADGREAQTEEAGIADTP